MLCLYAPGSKTWFNSLDRGWLGECRKLFRWHADGDIQWQSQREVTFIAGDVALAASLVMVMQLTGTLLSLELNSFLTSCNFVVGVFKASLKLFLSSLAPSPMTTVGKDQTHMRHMAKGSEISMLMLVCSWKSSHPPSSWNSDLQSCPKPMSLISSISFGQICSTTTSFGKDGM